MCPIRLRLAVALSLAVAVLAAPTLADEREAQDGEGARIFRKVQERLATVDRLEYVAHVTERQPHSSGDQGLKLRKVRVRVCFARGAGARLEVTEDDTLRDTTVIAAGDGTQRHHGDGAVEVVGDFPLPCPEPLILDPLLELLLSRGEKLSALLSPLADLTWKRDTQGITAKALLFWHLTLFVDADHQLRGYRLRSTDGEASEYVVMYRDVTSPDSPFPADTFVHFPVAGSQDDPWHQLLRHYAGVQRATYTIRREQASHWDDKAPVVYPVRVTFVRERGFRLVFRDLVTVTDLTLRRCVAHGDPHDEDHRTCLLGEASLGEAILPDEAAEDLVLTALRGQREHTYWHPQGWTRTDDGWDAKLDDSGEESLSLNIGADGGLTGYAVRRALGDLTVTVTSYKEPDDVPEALFAHRPATDTRSWEELVTAHVDVPRARYTLAVTKVREDRSKEASERHVWFDRKLGLRIHDQGDYFGETRSRLLVTDWHLLHQSDSCHPEAISPPAHECDRETKSYEALRDDDFVGSSDPILAALLGAKEPSSFRGFLSWASSEPAPSSWAQGRWARHDGWWVALEVEPDSGYAVRLNQAGRIAAFRFTHASDGMTCTTEVTGYEVPGEISAAQFRLDVQAHQAEVR
ncbi:outer membrane lipoprotein carrier protein LolA [Planctomycetota bacterium]